MKLSKADQGKLLQLQQADLQVSRLKHRVESDPLLEKLRELDGRAADLRRSVVAQKADLADRTRKITEVQHEVDKVEERRELQQERLDSGKVPLRDMSAVEHEIGKIVERKEQLELEVMELEDDYERREKFLADTEKAAVALVEDTQQTKQNMAEGQASTVHELEVQEELAQELRGQLPASVLDEYDHLRSRMGALVVLRFEDGMLRDSPVHLSFEEEAALKRSPEDELWESDETGYLIVRV